jgi:ubiquinone/menaquinone biosynthesis C-methylase UbiE
MKTKKVPGGNELLNAHDILVNKLGVAYGARVADLGCGGNGFFTFQAAELVGDEGVVYALDILKMVLKNVEHRAKMFGINNIKTVWSNLENYGAAKINDDSMDFVLLINVLFQNKHPEKIIREATRVLRSGGKMLIIDWSEGRFPFGPSGEMKITRERVNDVALGAGLKKVKDIEVGRFHYGIIFERI